MLVRCIFSHLSMRAATLSLSSVDMLSQPGSVFCAFAYEVRRGAQYSSGSVVYRGQTRWHCVYIAPEKIGYVPCFCDGCGDTQVWVTTNIVYVQIVHDSQGVASLGLEKLYPVLPSETSIYFCYDFYSLMVVLLFLVCYIILRAFGFQVPDIDFF